MLFKEAKQKYKMSMIMVFAAMFVAGSVALASGMQEEVPDEHEEMETYEVLVMVQPDDGGDVEGAGDYYPGDEVVLTATAEEGYEFLQWTDNIQGFVVSSDTEYVFEMPDEDVQLTALFVELLD